MEPQPLAEGFPVSGYIETELFVGSTAPDTDFTVKLVDVAPDPYTSTEFQVATNKVLHGPSALSRITLPVVTLPAR